MTITEWAKANIVTYINQVAKSPHQAGLLLMAISRPAVHRAAHRANHRANHRAAHRRVLPAAVLRGPPAVAATAISPHQEPNPPIAVERRKGLRINLMMMAMMISTWMAIMMMRGTEPIRIMQTVLTMPWMNLMGTGKMRKQSLEQLRCCFR